MAASPVQPVIGVAGRVRPAERGEQVPDLRDGQRDHAGFGGGRLIGPDWRRGLGIGAVAEQRGGHGADRRTLRSTVYVIVADISDATRGGGRALGEVVRYRAAGRTYTLKAEEGMAIGSALVPIDRSCDAQLKDLSAALVGKS